MTVIAWDGKSAAVDKQSISFGVPEKTTKYKKLKTGEVALWAGTHQEGLLLTQWYEDGAKPKDWPKFQTNEDFTNLVIISKEGVKEYGDLPVAIVIEDEFYALGSGSKVALGALAMGATAEEAVQAAIKLDIYSGKGVDVFHFGEDQ